ncbi:hypothetical protein DSM21852_34900 [Methylocystis bryophila]|nr:hypothetical protein DSM21852_34900 [Methylocystis bryophila]
MSDDAALVLGQPFANEATRRAQGVEETRHILGREGRIDNLSRDRVIPGLDGAEVEGHSRGIV